MVDDQGIEGVRTRTQLQHVPHCSAAPVTLATDHITSLTNRTAEICVTCAAANRGCSLSESSFSKSANRRQCKEVQSRQQRGCSVISEHGRSEPPVCRGVRQDGGTRRETDQAARRPAPTAGSLATVRTVTTEAYYLRASLEDQLI